MRRVVVILLTLVLVPSLATASWYRCAFDGKTRAVCCCPTKPDPQNKAPAQDASVRAAWVVCPPSVSAHPDNSTGCTGLPQTSDLLVRIVKAPQAGASEGREVEPLCTEAP